MRRRYLFALVVVIGGISSFGCTTEGESPLGHLTTQVVSNRDAEIKKLRSSPYYRPVTEARGVAHADLGALCAPVSLAPFNRERRGRRR